MVELDGTEIEKFEEIGADFVAIFVAILRLFTRTAARFWVSVFETLFILVIPVGVLD